MTEVKFEVSKQRCRAALVSLAQRRRKTIFLEKPPLNKVTKPSPRTPKKIPQEQQMARLRQQLLIRQQIIPPQQQLNVQHTPSPTPHTPSPHTPLPPKPPTHTHKPIQQRQHNIPPNQQQHAPSPRTPTPQKPLHNTPTPQKPLHSTPTPQKPLQYTPTPQKPLHNTPTPQNPSQHIPSPQTPTPQKPCQHTPHSPTHTQKLQTPHKPQLDDEPLATYPQGKGGNTIYTTDLHCLDEGQWLNDTAINVLLHWVQQEVWAGHLVNQTRICNSFWFTRVSRNTLPGNTTAIGDNLIQMRRWYPGGHPFTVPIVGIPVCLQQHWVAVMVIQRECETWLWGMDSLRSTVLRDVREVLTSTVQMCCPGKKVVWTDISVPRQKNSFDCGVHAIKNKTGQYMATEASPTARSLEMWLRDSPHLTRQEMRAAFRGITQGRTHAQHPFLMNSVEELMAELNISLEEEDEDMGLTIPPSTELSLGTNFCVFNHTQEIMRVDEPLEQQLLMWASNAREGLKKPGRRRLIFLRTWQGCTVRLTARSSGFVKAVVNRIC